MHATVKKIRRNFATTSEQSGWKTTSMPYRFFDGEGVEHESAFLVPEHQTEIQSLPGNQIPVLKFNDNRCPHRDLAGRADSGVYARAAQAKGVIAWCVIAFR